MSTRTAVLVVHLICSAALGVYVYGAEEGDDTMKTLVAAIFFPLLVITGFMMWFGARAARKRGSPPD